MASPNIKTGGSWLAVKMFCDQYYQPKKNICTRALKSAQNRTGVKTGQVFLIIQHILLQTQVYDNHQYKVSIILNNIPKENKQTSSFKCDLLQIKDPLKLERENK